MPDLLPGYTWDRRVARFRSTTRGHFVSRNRIIELLEQQVSGTERRLGDIVTAMHEGNLSPSFGQSLMRDELRRAHLQQAALGAGGFDRLSFREFGRVGRSLRDDYERLTNLANDIQEGRVTLPQALNRVRGYAGDARLQFFEAERDARRQAASSGGVALLVIRDLGAAEHCPSCVDYYQMGWQPDLPPPGTQSECGSHCRCGMRYREVPITEAGEFIGTRRQ